MPNTIKYLKSEKARLYKDSTSDHEIMELLWGDRIELLSDIPENGRYKARARWAKSGYVNASSLGDEPLLEMYFIDVGQGDGILIVTPDRKHILIDGGYTRDKQPHGKSAADFVDWKFVTEYGGDKIVLDAMISSHCDADHYGGLWDLLRSDAKSELDATNVEVKNFYHAGISWWKDDQSNRFLGKTVGGAMYDLLSDKASVTKGLKDTSNPRLQGEWAQFIKCISDSGANISRLSYNPAVGFTYLPGFDNTAPLSIKILGPIETMVNGQATLKDFGKDSFNTNGNSVLLRVDYGRSRILLTGDLNQLSQQYILTSLTGNTQELAADVVKSCHHGSDDCSWEFLSRVQAGATVISSGDDETHAHPRPNIVAASGATGFRKIENDEVITPLVYSTEISRSYKLGDPYRISSEGYSTPNGPLDIDLTNEEEITVSFKQVASGALKAIDKQKTLNKLKIVDGIVYGLVNVRTDGDKILCATLNEGKSKWEIKTFRSRF